MPDLFPVLESKVCNGECSWQEILSEIEAIKSEGSSFDYMLFIRLQDDVESLSHNNLNQYQLYRRKELFQKLSKDARRMAKVIILCTNGHKKFAHMESELFHKEKITKARIYHVMKKYFRWTMRRVEKTFVELTNYCNELRTME